MAGTVMSKRERADSGSFISIVFIAFDDSLPPPDLGKLANWMPRLAKERLERG